MLFENILHLSLQYLTSSQHLSHFFLHVKDLLQTAQSLKGKFDFFGFFTSMNSQKIQRECNAMQLVQFAYVPLHSSNG